MSNESSTVALMLRSALPIDDVDQMEMVPGQRIILVWIDVQDRPDLADLAAKHREGEGIYRLTWFAASPGERKMILGLRVEMESAVPVIFHLAFKVEHYFDQLEMLAYSGQLWVVPGPPPTHLTGTREMDAQEVIALFGKGVQFELSQEMKALLRVQLTAWKQRSV